MCVCVCASAQHLTYSHTHTHPSLAKQKGDYAKRGIFVERRKNDPSGQQRQHKKDTRCAAFSRTRAYFSGDDRTRTAATRTHTYCISESHISRVCVCVYATPISFVWMRDSRAYTLTRAHARDYNGNDILFSGVIIYVIFASVSTTIKTTKDGLGQARIANANNGDR